MNAELARLTKKRDDLTVAMVERHAEEMRALTVQHLREIRQMNEAYQEDMREVGLEEGTSGSNENSVLCKYLAFLKYIDGGRTYLFTQSGRVSLKKFKIRFWSWVRCNTTAVRISWEDERIFLAQYDLKIDGADLVGLSEPM